MARRAREQRVLAAIRRVLDPDERVVGRGRCWVAVRRPHVPVLLLQRRQHDAFLTDRRLVLVARRRSLASSDVLLVKRFDALRLEPPRRRPTLLQQRLHTDTGQSLVLEWPRRSRALAEALADAVRAQRPTRRTVPSASR